MRNAKFGFYVMTESQQYLCRRLQEEEVERGLAILHDAYIWLSDRGIRQWTQPLSPQVYSDWQEQGCNHGLFVDGELAVVFSLVWGSLHEWPSHDNFEMVLWLHALATSQAHLHRGLGEHAVRYAINHFNTQSDCLYLTCSHGSGFLPAYYERLGFKRLDRNIKNYEEFGDYDMVLMQYTPDKPNKAMQADAFGAADF